MGDGGAVGGAGVFVGAYSPAAFHEDGLEEAAEENFFQDGSGDTGDRCEDDSLIQGDVVLGEQLQGWMGVGLLVFEVFEGERNEHIDDDQGGVNDEQAQEAVTDAFGQFAEAESPAVDSTEDEAGAEEKN